MSSVCVAETGKADQKTLSVEPGTTLKVYNKNGDIEIIGWDRDIIEVNTIRASTALFAKEPTVEISGGKECIVRTVYGSFLSQSARIQYRINVPKDVFVADVETSNGKIMVEKVSGDVSARTSNGGIQITRVDGFVKAVTSNGTIKIAGVRGLYEARNSSQDIQVEVPAIRDSVAICSSSGSISIALARDVSAQLEARTSGGTIVFKDLPFAVSESSPKRITGKLGEGRGSIRVATSSGSIDLKELL